jgi:hypothetical protein
LGCHTALTITGPAAGSQAIVDCQFAGKFITTTNSNLTMIGVTVRNAYSGVNGGAILFGVNVYAMNIAQNPGNYPMQLLVQSCTFLNCATRGSGGAIYFLASDFMNGTFNASAGVSPYVAVIMQSTTFNNCSAVYDNTYKPEDELGLGGAACLLFYQTNTNGSLLLLSDLTVSNCSAQTYGGGMHICETHGGTKTGQYQYTVQRSTFTDCRAIWGGGIEFLQVSSCLEHVYVLSHSDLFRILPPTATASYSRT